MRRLNLSTLLFLSFLGCSGKATDDSGSNGTTGTAPAGLAASLMDRDFQLASADGYEPVADSTIHLGFRTSYNGGPGFSLGGGCNSISGNFELVDDTMVVSKWSMTEMGCSTELMDQDDWLLSFITSAPHLALDGDTLTVTGSAATLVFLDSEVADPDRTLTDHTWTVDSYIDGKAISNFNLAADPILTFSTEGNVGFDTGCNQGSGRYTADGTEITFSKMSMTAAECDDKMAQQAESILLSVITDGTSSYTIDASRLTIERGTQGISATTD